MSVALSPGEPPASIRLQSGAYFSPVVKVTGAPMRLAMPYPAPYETGRGVLTAYVSGGAVALALMPGVRAASVPGGQPIPVTWPVDPTCATGH